MGERFREERRNTCTYLNCKASFSKSWKLEAHLCKHTGLRPFACPSCDKSFCTRYQLTRHQLFHSGDKPYRCSVEGCPQAFTTNSSMKNHLARVHLQKEKRYVCDIEGCGQEFRKKNKLRTHRFDHTQNLPFECTFEGCHKRFATVKPLDKHGKVHNGYPCVEPGCSFQGNTWTDFQEHKKRQHRATLHCDSCKKVFSKAWFLLMHRHRVHLGKKRTFPCTVQGCKDIYTTKFNLQSHVLTIHEGKTPYKCAHLGCNKAFAMKESLRRHRVVHDPERKKMKNNAPKSSKKPGPAAVAVGVKLAASFQKLKLGPKTTAKGKGKPAS